MKASKSKLTLELVRELLDYNPATGIFIYKPHRIELFATYRSACSWKARHEGRRAFCFEMVSPSGTKYFAGHLLGEQHPAHRMAFFWMKGRWPVEVDHEDQDGQNNRWPNLSECTRAVNTKNRHHNRNSSRPHPGVRRYGKKWQAAIQSDRKPIYLGTFDDAASAIVARKSAEARLGFSHNHGSLRK